MMPSYRTPNDIPLYRVLDALLSERGYSTLVQSHTSLEDIVTGRSEQLHTTDEVYALHRASGNPASSSPHEFANEMQCYDLHLTLAELACHADTPLMRRALAGVIDRCCTPGHTHQHCQCAGVVVLVAQSSKEPQTTDDRGSQHHPQTYRVAVDGPQGQPATHCPQCGIRWSPETVQPFDEYYRQTREERGQR